MPVAPPLAASARSLLVAGLPTVSHPAERAAVITIKIATVTRTPRAPSKQPHRTEEYRPKVLPDTLTLAAVEVFSGTLTHPRCVSRFTARLRERAAGRD